MTVNVGALYKPNEAFGLVAAEECTKKKHPLKIKFVVWYILIAILITTCIVLSILSLRLSFMASESVRELKLEVTKLKAMLDNNWNIENAEFTQAAYDDYPIPVLPKKLAKPPRVKLNTQPVNAINRTDVIGVLKLAKTDDITTENPESLLVKELLKHQSKERLAKSTEVAAESKPNIKTALKIEQQQQLVVTANQNPQRVKREADNTRMLKQEFKIPIVSSKLVKPPINLHDSVEEFSIASELMTAKPDVLSKRNKNRSRHNIETLDERPGPSKRKFLPAIHFDGDSSGYVVGKHTNYNGNGHLSHPSQVYSDWVEAEWVKTLGMSDYFQLEKGTVKVKESGLYLLYFQIYYLDDHDTNGYRVYKNNEPFVQCTTMTHSTERVFKGNTCYTSRIEYLKENDVISVHDLANGRYTIFESGKSFFGLVKLK